MAANGRWQWQPEQPEASPTPPWALAANVVETGTKMPPPVSWCPAAPCSPQFILGEARYLMCMVPQDAFLALPYLN